MGNVNNLLSERLNKKANTKKMAEMAKRSADGSLTSFSGIFNIVELNEGEKNYLEALLYEFSTDKSNLKKDLSSLISITSEVKAINTQASILHGERIKKAHSILTKYEDGAFSQWLIATYGNRQTPYNFLQYYEFWSEMPKKLRPQIELMPRQAIYTLASREAPIEDKRKIIEDYNGETKSELLTLIREIFPLRDSDRRRENIGEMAINSLTRLFSIVDRKRRKITRTQRATIRSLLNDLLEII